MRKKLLTFIIITTLLAGLVMGLLVHFTYYRLHMMAQPYFTALDYDTSQQDGAYDLTITNAYVEAGSWQASDATIYIDICNQGTASVSSFCDLSVTLVNVSGDAPTTFAVDADIRDCAPGQTITLAAPINLRKLGFGQYSLYFKAWNDKTTSVLPLDNNLKQTRDGYFLGTLSVSHFINF